MAYKDHTLTFSDTKIVDTSYDNMEVMMSWEAPIMEKTAEYICQSKGDILEIGFGMGMCADYIQAQSVNSHTIVEIHPQIIEKLNTWASGKSNVTVVEGDWWAVKDSLSTYDGIFLDTFNDDSWLNFKAFVEAKAKSGAKVSHWNNFEKEFNEHGFSNISFEKVSVTPDSNTYTTIVSNYYMPKVST